MVDNKPFLIRLVGIIELIKSTPVILLMFLPGPWFVIIVNSASAFQMIRMLVSVVGLIAAIAVIRYKPIGRKLFIFVGSSSIILTLIGVLDTFIATLMPVWFLYIFGIFSILYYGAVIGYFMTSEAKNAFEPPVSGNKKV